ncbi:MAG: hypothetical protein EPN91_05150 [Salinibacterium sp.]|nr:MAG: hypothetical protein EPN91_05150 [Salinibacterium sp.]
MVPIVACPSVISARLDFQHRHALVMLARLRDGKPSMWDDEPVDRKTKGVDFVKAAQGPALEAQRLGFPIQVVDGVAIISLSGAMDRMGDWYGQASTAEVTVAVNAAKNDPSIAASVIIANSPGGSVDGLAELGDAVRAHADAKPIYAQVEGGAYSAAYYAIAHATQIFAHRMDEVGSIGTILGTWDMSKYFADLGIEVVVIATGWMKGAGFPGAPITQEQRDEWQRNVNLYYADFKKQVQMGRELTAKQVSDLATGQYWTASEALDNGLIDRVQSTADTIAKAQARAANAAKVRGARAKMDAVLGKR